MPTQNWKVTLHNLMRGYAGLPRAQICTRAVHHIFNPESETEEADDDDEAHVHPVVKP
jgi:hypothetical protein